MQYIYDGEFYKIVKITGPKHNILSLCFTKNINEIEVADLNKLADDGANIDPSEVKNQVLIGIREINNELCTDYKVSKIQFISSDSYSNTIYIELTKNIIRRIEKGGEFTFVKISSSTK